MQLLTISKYIFLFINFNTTALNANTFYINAVLMSYTASVVFTIKSYKYLLKKYSNKKIIGFIVFYNLLFIIFINLILYYNELQYNEQKFLKQNALKQEKIDHLMQYINNLHFVEGLSVEEMILEFDKKMQLNTKLLDKIREEREQLKKLYELQKKTNDYIEKFIV